MTSDQHGGDALLWADDLWREDLAHSWLIQGVSRCNNWPTVLDTNAAIQNR